MSTSLTYADSGYGSESHTEDIEFRKESQNVSGDPEDSSYASESSSQRITIPDLFESFLSRKPSINPSYTTVAEQSIDWISRICSYTTLERSRLHKADFGYFAAVAYPEADPARLKTMTDWFNWVFAFDDQLDDGLVQDEQAKEYIDGMQAMLEDSDPDRVLLQRNEPSQYALKTIYKALQQDLQYSEEARRRWLHRMGKYFSALRDSIGFEPSADIDDTVNHYMSYRFYSIAVLPILSFTEYASGLRLPEFVFQDNAMVEIERIGVKLQILANDCVSYHRERDLGCPHNIIHLLRHHGLSEQEAYDRVQALLRNLYTEWYLVHARLPIWGEQIDDQVHQYIKGIQNVALANLHWSFRSERYFGKHRDEVRRTRRVEFAPAQSDWLPSVVPKPEVEVNEMTRIQY